MKQAEQNAAASTFHHLEAASFGELLTTVEQIGANQGDPRVIELYRTWISLHGPGGPHAHAAWFNLGAEWNLAGDHDNAILA